MKIGVVVEGASDLRVLEALLDRLLANIDWLRGLDLAQQRTWMGVEDGQRCLIWSRIPALARARQLHVHGRGSAGEALAARKAIALLRMAQRQLDAIILLRDEDRDAGRRGALEQARDAIRPTKASPDALPVAIGVAVPEVEAWAIVAFEPRDEVERTRLAELIRELEFNPCKAPHRLTSKREHEARDAKRVLHVLTDGNAERGLVDLRERDLDELRQVGRGSGLAELLVELQTEIMPLYSSARADASKV